MSTSLNKHLLTILDLRKIALWAEAHPAEEDAGIPGDSCRCPISAYIRAHPVRGFHFDEVRVDDLHGIDIEYHHGIHRGRIALLGHAVQPVLDLARAADVIEGEETIRRERITFGEFRALIAD